MPRHCACPQSPLIESHDDHLQNENRWKFLHGNEIESATRESFNLKKHIHRNARSWSDVTATAAMSIVNALELSGIQRSRKIESDG
jgi:hypothetical protein